MLNYSNSTISARRLMQPLKCTQAYTGKQKIVRLIIFTVRAINEVITKLCERYGGK